MVKISGNGCVRAVSVPLLKPTFGRCAENPEDRLTFGRWEMVKISGNGCVRAVSVPLLNSTFGRCAENPENRLTFGRWEMVKISGNGCVRAVSVPLLNPIPPSEGVQKTRESSHLRKVGKREDGTAGEVAGSVRLMGQRERWPAQCALRNVSSAVKYSSVWVNAAWRCLQSNSRRVTSGEVVRGSSRRRGLTVSSVAWISSMGTEMS